MADYYRLKPTSDSVCIKGLKGYDYYHRDHIYTTINYDQLEDIYVLLDVEKDNSNQYYTYIKGRDLHMYFDLVAHNMIIPGKDTSFKEEVSDDWFQELKCELLDHSMPFKEYDLIDVEDAINVISSILKPDLS